MKNSAVCLITLLTLSNYVFSNANTELTNRDSECFTYSISKKNLKNQKYRAFRKIFVHVTDGRRFIEIKAISRDNKLKTFFDFTGYPAFEMKYHSFSTPKFKPIRTNRDNIMFCSTDSPETPVSARQGCIRTEFIQKDGKQILRTKPANKIWYKGTRYIDEKSDFWMIQANGTRYDSCQDEKSGDHCRGIKKSITLETAAGKSKDEEIDKSATYELKSADCDTIRSFWSRREGKFSNSF